MLCPAPTGKSGKSWLDRLRTAKGFPENGVNDLEQFLQNPNSPTHEMPQSKPNSASISDPPEGKDEQLFSMMSNVLNELFNFGDKCSNSAKVKKSARKQTNPRICAVPNNGGDASNAASVKVALLRSGDSNSGVEGVRELCKWDNEGGEEGFGRDGNLIGFSRTEVTVIDTSYECWKFDKLLYKKKNVWKVRDKKGKCEIVGSKKKKKVSVETEENQRGGKKSKVDDFSSNEMNKSEIHEKASNKVGGILKKKRSRSDLNLEDGNASVILIKSIHTSNKNGTSISKSYLKSKQKKA
ncbi:hypothetical protein ACP275_06G097800 [Erythranthe tilingii]